MNQDKLQVVKQEITRVNIDILGISELKWTGMGGFNSDDPCIYHCGQEPLRRNGIALIINKRVWNAVLGCNLKNKRKIFVCFQGKPFNITVILTSNAEEAEVEQFYENLQDLLELTSKKDVLFIIEDWNAKIRESRNTLSNRQIWPWKRTEIILSFLRLHPSTTFRTLLLTMMATPFLLRDSCPQ